MMKIGIIVFAICLVVFLIYAWFRTCSFPPNARLLFDAWNAVGKMPKNNKATPRDRNKSSFSPAETIRSRDHYCNHRSGSA